MHEEVCPECQGDGYLIYVGSPGYYSEGLGNWLPSEEWVRCPRCGGRGRVEVEDAQAVEVLPH